jgi:competence protein ComGC
MYKSKKYLKQKGQALLYVAVLIIIMVSGVFFVYDLGNIVHNKIKFQNGADAAALSAVSLKISKHHIDALVRTSMFHESIAAQAQQRAAQALLAQILLDLKKHENPITAPPSDIPAGRPNPPVSPPGNTNPSEPIIVNPIIPPTEQQKQQAREYIRLSNLTYKHVMKFHRERLALETFYKWLSDESKGVAPKAVLETSRIGLRGNTIGLIDPKEPVLAKNLNILNQKEDLLENKKEFTLTIGGVAYGGEGSGIKGNFGKTFIEFDGNAISSKEGISLLKYSGAYSMITNAAAKIVSSEEKNKGERTLIRIPLTSGLPSGEDLLNPDPAKGLFLPFEMVWYSPALMSIELKKDVTIH